MDLFERLDELTINQMRFTLYGETLSAELYYRTRMELLWELVKQPIPIPVPDRKRRRDREIPKAA